MQIKKLQNLNFRHLSRAAFRIAVFQKNTEFLSYFLRFFRKFKQKISTIFMIFSCFNVFTRSKTWWFVRITTQIFKKHQKHLINHPSSSSFPYFTILSLTKHDSKISGTRNAPKCPPHETPKRCQKATKGKKRIQPP